MLAFGTIAEFVWGIKPAPAMTEQEEHEVSVKAGERTLLPRAREASPHTLILTDGFSCRSQIEHGSNRGALHLAQVVQMALREGPNGPSLARPEVRYTRSPR